MRILKAKDLTWDRLREEAQKGSLFFLSVTPLEDHASHLPCGTDPLICEALAERVATLTTPIPNVGADPGSSNAILLPTWYQGASLLRSLGCLRWTPRFLTRALVEYGRELAEIGVRRLVLLSSHGAFDHIRALERAAKALEVSTRMNVAAPSGPLLNSFLAGEFHSKIEDRLGRKFNELESRELYGDVHAAGWETSLVLHLAPHLVDEGYRDLPPFPIFEGKRLKLRALSRHRGYFGSPAVASADLGLACIDVLSEEAALVVDEFCQRPVRDRRRRPNGRVRKKLVGVAVLALAMVAYNWLKPGDGKAQPTTETSESSETLLQKISRAEDSALIDPA